MADTRVAARASVTVSGNLVSGVISLQSDTVRWEPSDPHSAMPKQMNVKTITGNLK